VKKGQSSLEFLVITAIGLFLIGGVTYGFLSYNQDTQEKARVQQATYVGNQLITAATSMYSKGTNSWTTIDVSMPPDLLAVYTVENNTLVFDVGTAQGTISQPVFSDVPIAGVRLDGSKLHLNNGTVVIHDGQTKFRVTSLGSVVTIQAIS
jgi:hypothetical protein